MASLRIRGGYFGGSPSSLSRSPCSKHTWTHKFRAPDGVFPASLLIGAAGHFGGILVHGDDFFTW
jgi:hypothetical protein